MKKIRLLLWILMLCVPLVVSCGPKDGKEEPSATVATEATETTGSAITGRPKSTGTGEATSEKTPETTETTEKPSVETETTALPEQTTQKEPIELPII